MISLVSLPASLLCRIVEDTSVIFSDSFVIERFREAQESMGDEPAFNSALSAFASTIAPVLLSEKYKANTISILSCLKGDTADGSGMIRDLFTLILLDKDYSALTIAIRKYGADRVIAALHRYGTPPTMSALSSLLAVQEEQREWEIYMADMTAAIVRALVGKPAEKLPFYSDMVKKTYTDSRSGKQIVEDIIAKLKKRKGNRKI